MIDRGMRERGQGNVGVNLDYVINSIQEMQDRQNQRISEMENMLSTQTGNLEESKSANSGFPRRTSFPIANDSEYSSRGAAAADGYNLGQALNSDAMDIHDMNERTALQRILSRDTADPLFPSASNPGGASRILREMRDERLRRH